MPGLPIRSPSRSSPSAPCAATLGDDLVQIGVHLGQRLREAGPRRLRQYRPQARRNVAQHIQHHGEEPVEVRHHVDAEQRLHDNEQRDASHLNQHVHRAGRGRPIEHDAVSAAPHCLEIAVQAFAVHGGIHDAAQAVVRVAVRHQETVAQEPGDRIIRGPPQQPIARSYEDEPGGFGADHEHRTKGAQGDLEDIAQFLMENGQGRQHAAPRDDGAQGASPGFRRRRGKRPPGAWSCEYCLVGVPIIVLS